MDFVYTLVNGYYWANVITPVFQESVIPRYQDTKIPYASSQSVKKNGLLAFMLLCYLFPILFVYYNYNSNNSVSNIICNDNCKNYILFFMGLMGIGTILYELERNDTYSQILIYILLIGLYGLIYIDETFTVHYIFAFQVFISILLFMIRQCYLTYCNMTLLSSLVLQVLTLLSIIILFYIDESIYYAEIVYILNFAFYYLYLHFIQ